jgi:hypothetical protein
MLCSCQVSQKIDLVGLLLPQPLEDTDGRPQSYLGLIMLPGTIQQPAPFPLCQYSISAASSRADE